MHYIGVIQKHVTVFVGRCATFGELIRKYGGGKGWECVRRVESLIKFHYFLLMCLPKSLVIFLYFVESIFLFESFSVLSNVF